MSRCLRPLPDEYIDVISGAGIDAESVLRAFVSAGEIRRPETEALAVNRRTAVCSPAMAHSDNFQVGLVGFGLAGRVFHAPTIAASAGLTLAAVVTRRAEEVRAAHPSATVVRSVDELLRLPAIDIVVVATRTRRTLRLPHRRSRRASTASSTSPLRSPLLKERRCARWQCAMAL